MSLEPDVIEDVTRAAGRFADRHFAGDALAVDRAGRGLSPEILVAGARAGFHSLVLPQRTGGAGLGMPALCALVASLAERCAGHAMVFGVQAAVLGALAEALGPDAALPVARLVADGGPIGVCLAEPAGDAGFETGLVVAGDGAAPRLEGCPGVAINTGRTALTLLFGRDRFGAATALLVDMRDRAVDAAGTLGLRAMPMARLDFDGRPLAGVRRLANGACVEALFRTLSMNLCLVASAAALGVMTRASAVAVRYAAGRHQGGKMIIEHSHLAELIGGMRATVETARASVHAAAEACDEALVTATKLRVALAAVEVSTDAVQVLGGNGYMHGFGVEKAMRDAAVLSLIPFSNCRAALLLTAIEKRRLNGG